MAAGTIIKKSRILVSVLCAFVIAAIPISRACASVCAVGPDMPSCCCRTTTQAAPMAGCCCCDTGDRSCHVSQNQTDPFDFSVNTVPNLEKPDAFQGGAVSADTPMLSGSARGFIKHLRAHGAGPPLPLFLINLSFLC